MAVTAAQLQQLYLAYFGRPADFDGLVYYTTGDWDIWQVAQGFSESPESQALYGTGFNASVINNIYQNLFNRDAEPAGLLYWSQQVASGALTAAGAALGILLGAQNEDLTTVNNKLAVSAAFTNALDTAPEIIGYTGADAAAAARAFLHTVTADPATVTAAMANLDAAVAAVVGVGGVIGASFTLTDSVDTITITDSTTINTVNGVVDGATPANSTFSIGDNIDGNGKTILELAVASTGSTSFATVKDVADVRFTAGAAGTLNVNTVNWSNVGQVSLNNGVDGLTVQINSLSTNTDISVGTGVSGTISATYTNDVFVWAWSDRGSSISFIDGAVTGTANTDGNSMIQFTAQADDTPITVGNVNITAAGNDGSQAWVGITNTANNVGGDITVGNVSITGFADHIWFSAYNQNHTSSADAVNNTVGDVTLTGVGDATVEFYMYNTGTGAIGDQTVGAVNLTSGKNGNISATIDSYSGGGLSTGNVTVGALGVVLGTGGAGYLSITNEATGSTTDTVSAGNTSVSSVAMNLGQNASFNLDLDITAHNWSLGTGSASVGDVVVGGTAMVLAQNAHGSVSIDVNATASAAATANASIGNVTLGDTLFTVALDADAVYNVYITANAGATGTASIGDVWRGTTTGSVGINATLSTDLSISASGTDASIGNVTIGDVNLTGDDGAYITLSTDIDSDGSVGDVVNGNVTFALGVSATAYLWNYVSAATMGNYTVGDINVTGAKNSSYSSTYTVEAFSGDIGDVSIGNVTLNMGESASAELEMTISASNDIASINVGNINLTGAKNADVSVSLSFSAWSHDIGDITIGDITTKAAAGAEVDAFIYVSSEHAMGNVNVGDLSMTVTGKSASSSISVTVENDGSGVIGDITFGNVTASVNGEAATGYIYISASSADEVGTLTVGNLDLSVGNSAGKTGSNLDVNIGVWSGNVTTGGDVVVGDILLNGASERGFLADGVTPDATMTYTADVSIWANGKVTVGNITVTGGDGDADNFATLTNWLTLGGTSNTIGTVDYSGYGAAATLDVSTFKGAAAVIGGAGKDVITVDKGTHALTGNGAADTFTFLNGSTNKTEATLSSITDFNNAGGDKIDLTLAMALDTTTYGENTYADFATFVTGANAANKEVFVGQVGSNSFVAVDHDNDGTVDFMIKLVGVSLSTIDVASFV